MSLSIAKANRDKMQLMLQRKLKAQCHYDKLTDVPQTCYKPATLETKTSDAGILFCKQHVFFIIICIFIIIFEL